MDKLLITGGAQRPKASRLGEGRRFQAANLIELDFDTGSYNSMVTIDRPNEHYPDDLPNITFTSCALEEGILYLCSETELFVYSYPELKLLKSASFPFLQNTHHIAPVCGYIGVASTGLDLVVLLDKDTLEPLRFINTLGQDPWHRFSESEDYRKIHSTKPHESHPNYIFELKGQIWATRFNQKDAVCLDDLQKQIKCGAERIHDGHVIGDKVYFTTVDGTLVVADGNKERVDHVVNLNEIEKQDMPLGWCRGLLIEGPIAYVAFTRIRQTPIKENVKWLLGYVGRKASLPTRIVKYDLENRVKIGECTAPKGVIDAIYSVYRA